MYETWLILINTVVISISKTTSKCFVAFPSSRRILSKKVWRGHNYNMMIHKICQLGISEPLFIYWVLIAFPRKPRKSRVCSTYAIYKYWRKIIHYTYCTIVNYLSYSVHIFTFEHYLSNKNNINRNRWNDNSFLFLIWLFYGNKRSISN